MEGNKSIGKNFNNGLLEVKIIGQIRVKETGLKTLHIEPKLEGFVCRLQVEEDGSRYPVFLPADMNIGIKEDGYKLQVGDWLVVRGTIIMIYDNQWYILAEKAQQIYNDKSLEYAVYL